MRLVRLNQGQVRPLGQPADDLQAGRAGISVNEYFGDHDSTGSEIRGPYNTNHLQFPKKNRPDRFGWRRRLMKDQAEWMFRAALRTNCRSQRWTGSSSRRSCQTCT